MFIILQLMDNMDKYMEAGDYTTFLWVPHTDDAVVLTNRRTKKVTYYSIFSAIYSLLKETYFLVITLYHTYKPYKCILFYR